MIEVRNWIGGKRIDLASKDSLVSFNPATDEPIAKIPRSGEAEVNAAVVSALRSFPVWSQTPPAERSLILNRIADEIEKRADEFARMESLDQGKPLWLAKSMDIPRAILNFRFFASALSQWRGEITHPQSDVIHYTMADPVGIVGLISPWNLPLYLLTWKLAPALAMGNCVIAKPSEYTSLTASLLGEVLEVVTRDHPALEGAVSLVFGLGSEAGEALVRHPEVKAISFTGGSQTGRRISEVAARSGKKLSLELGGKNASLVFADADMGLAVKTLVRSAFLNQGEICLCNSRIYVEASVFEEFRDRFVEQTKLLKIGDPRDSESFMGPLVSKEHWSKVSQAVDLATQSGARLLCGGARPSHLQSGNYFLPTVIVGASQSSACVQEEIFGPVATLAPFQSEEEAVQLVNDVRYGLSACVFTQNLSRAHGLPRRLQVGTVWVNTWMNRDLRMPFGGVKDSGLGREGGWESMRFFSEAKTVGMHFPSLIAES